MQRVCKDGEYSGCVISGFMKNVFMNHVLQVLIINEYYGQHIKHVQVGIVLLSPYLFDLTYTNISMFYNKIQRFVQNSEVLISSGKRLPMIAGPRNIVSDNLIAISIILITHKNILIIHHFIIS